ncbi:hypothetical protein GCM10009809_41800 [Isoptericola hypogeus]|uniref:Peptidase M43 pregnancy-associated plasma-A domain-containing protein n=1 Tax=Isoptericola hypogeus TaxID=300179 RepID=A0ABP4VYM2_9MICO
MPPKTKAEKSAEPELPARRRCATSEVHERLLRTVPGYIEARSAIEDRTLRMLSFGRAALRTGCTSIPVVVHVVHRTAAQNVSDAQVQSQIDVLNADFRAKNTDKSTVPGAYQPLIADARVTFKLATTDPDGNPTNGITRTSTTVSSFNTDLDDVKHASTGGADAWPADAYLNLWVCPAIHSPTQTGILGYAQFPGGPADTDGVVVVHHGFGTTGTAAAPFDLGRTATHEVGHWLDLRHIWGDDGTGCAGSDLVADTPNQGGPNFGTPTFPTISCSNGPNGDLFVNYMDYVDDMAMVMFTHGQVDRMQAALDGPRSTIGTSGPCDVKPIKEFAKDNPKDFVKEPIKEFVKDLPKDPIKDRIKDNPKEFVKENPKDFVKERPKDFIKDPIKDRVKDRIDDLVKDLASDVFPGIDPVKLAGLEPVVTNPLDPVVLPQVVNPVAPDLQPQVPTATPFVLGSQAAGQAGAAPGAQAAPAATDPLVVVLQQLGEVLAGYSSASRTGALDQASASRIQALSGIYSQLVALLSP